MSNHQNHQLECRRQVSELVRVCFAVMQVGKPLFVSLGNGSVHTVTVYTKQISEVMKRHINGSVNPEQETPPSNVSYCPPAAHEASFTYFACHWISRYAYQTHPAETKKKSHQCSSDRKPQTFEFRNCSTLSRKCLLHSCSDFIYIQHDFSIILVIFVCLSVFYLLLVLNILLSFIILT